MKKRWQQQSEENQTKTNTKRKEGNTKPENNSVQRGRIEERNDLKWKQGGLEKGWQETGWKERRRNEERKGATKIKPKKRNKNNISKGVDEKNNVEMDDRRKTRENDKPRVVLNKGLGGRGENKKNISRIAGNPLFVSAILAPLLKKKTRIAGENGVCCHTLKARQQTQTKKRKINPKNKNKEHNNNQDTNNRETRRPQMQENLGLERGMRWNWP